MSRGEVDDGDLVQRPVGVAKLAHQKVFFDVFHVRVGSQRPSVDHDVGQVAFRCWVAGFAKHVVGEAGAHAGWVGEVVVEGDLFNFANQLLVDEGIGLDGEGRSSEPPKVDPTKPLRIPALVTSNPSTRTAAGK